MLLKSLPRISRHVFLLNKRNCYSGQINSLFIDNFQKYSAKLKSESDLHDTREISKMLEEFTQLTENINDVEKEISNENQNDKEMASLMRDEKVELEAKQSELITKVLNEIYSYEISKDTERIRDSSNVLFEISAGVGGKEAMLFANELCDMYLNYFQYKNWETNDSELDEQGDCLRHYKARVEGRDVWGFMRFEAGVHRVQRVPETEARGRVHTSTVQIACIPISDNCTVELHGKQKLTQLIKVTINCSFYRKGFKDSN